MKSYCPHCDHDVSVFLKEEYQINTIKGVDVSTLLKIAYCSECNEKVYVPDINDENLDRIEEQYRSLNKIVLVSDIKNLLRKYTIGAKPLALLLGWGEVTIIRYLRGQLPNKEHNDKLKSLENPYVFWAVYRENSDVLKEAAKKKVDTALASLIVMSEENEVPERGLFDFFNGEPNIYSGFAPFNLKKVINTILYFLNHSGDTYKTKLNKLLWYADMLAYKRHSVSITGLSYTKHHYGPVPLRYEFLYGSLSEVYVSFVERDLGTQLSPLKSFDEGCFTKEEIQVLKDINDKFKDFYSTTITDYSHKEFGFINTKEQEPIPFHYAQELSIQ